MGLAERFKEELQTKNIFEINKKNDLNNGNIQFISVPTDNNPAEEIKDIENIPEEKNTVTKINSSLKFENLETEIIKKIRKTPYWNEYSKIRQENMISKYFDNKIQKPAFAGIEYTSQDKMDFIQNILVLSNNK